MPPTPTTTTEAFVRDLVLNSIYVSVFATISPTPNRYRVVRRVAESILLCDGPKLFCKSLLKYSRWSHSDHETLVDRGLPMGDSPFRMRELTRLFAIAGAACLVLLTVSMVSRAWSADRPGVTNRLRAAQLTEKFKQLDKDGDQKLTEIELGSGGLFAFLNLNGDDHVTLDEAKEAVRTKGYEELQKIASASQDAPAETKSLPTATTLEEIRQGPSRLIAGDYGIGSMIADVELTDINGEKIRLSDFRDKAALVVAVTNTSCPICKKYTPSLASIEDHYAPQNVGFIYLNPTASDKLDTIRTVIATNQLDGHYVRDDQGRLAKSLRATHTTDVFVLDPKRTLVYRGAVDDQYGFGYSIDEPKVTYLRNALDAVLAGESVEVAATTAPGCPLELPESGSAESADNQLTYHNRISRIVQNHCIECHR